MKRAIATLALCSTAWTMSGCVAALAPIAAAAMIGKKEVKHNSAPDLPGAPTEASATPPAATAPTAAAAPV
ncbi:hypothetical protein QH494_25170, partial [Sphingomonas sp. AR_OL41]|nr:hypothetical protein [Sphingomonas sp. AR_OL41]